MLDAPRLHGASATDANIGTRRGAARAVAVRLAAGCQGQHGDGGDEGDHQAHSSLLKVLLWIPCNHLSETTSNRSSGSPLWLTSRPPQPRHAPRIRRAFAPPPSGTVRGNAGIHATNRSHLVTQAYLRSDTSGNSAPMCGGLTGCPAPLCRWFLLAMSAFKLLKT